MANDQFTIVGNLLLKVDNAEAGLNRLKNGLSKLEIPKGLDKNLTKSFTNLDGILERYRTQLNKGFQTKGDVTNFSKIGKELDTEMSKLSKYMTELTGKTVDFKVNSEPIQRAEQELEKLLQKQEQLTNTTLSFKVDTEKGSSSIKEILEDIQKIAGDTGAGKAAGIALVELQLGNVDQAKVKLDEIIASYKRLGETKKEAEVAGTGLNIMQAATEVKNQIDTASNGLQQVKNEATQASEALAQMRYDQLGKAADECSKLAKGMEETEAATNQANKAAQEYAQSTYSMAKQMEQLQQSTQYFFSLRNMINLFKRGVREAVDVVKELDAAMTETAVVTDFSVGDMWEKLPEYTANANALGATVKDMYEATTLYYQQGLKTEAAMSIANETMKMARIGGLDAADATDKMTAALRGFNMEINETSAQRVNDVYSNLAAKTASNTEELGTAMQRTASIAASAGMSFEGTAAFLAQAIETTREPAENLGTAMKTIVARFTELKKNPLEITEVDGEEVSYNKIDTALQSIGVSLKDANGQFRDLDQVFLDISERWDSLSQTQQRYIATTAAGSRQQSRFIAMMSNYERTMQLMGYANNSAGASNEQFAKTMESLEAKINKLKNAWNQFLMNIMNDSWTKGIVDGATKVLDIVNKLINTLSFGNKGLKSALSLFTAFTGLKLAGKGANMLIGGLGGLVDPKSSVKQGLSTGALGGQAAKISNPIVKAIYSLIPHIDKAANNSFNKINNTTYSDYKNARQQIGAQVGQLSDIKDLGKLYGQKQYSLSGIQSIFDNNKISGAKEQNALLSSFPGLKRNMTKGLANILKDSGASPEVAKGLISGFKSGDITSQEILEKAGFLTNIDGKMAQMGEESAKAFLQGERQTVAKQNHSQIMQEISEKGIGKDEFKNYYNQRVDDLLKDKRYATSDQAKEAIEGLRDLSPAEKAANTFNAMGSALTSAGMSLQMLGSSISATNPLLGQLATSAGSLLTTVGSIPNMISSLIAGGPAVWAITAAVTALGVAFASVKAHETKIKDAAENVSKTFEENNKQYQDNISTLKSYREELATLSKGVDVNGNNVGLTDTDYNRYLEIVDRIAEINPKIVEGYNAQGHAIINNNKALEETLALQEKNQKQTLKNYISEDSLQKLLDARNINKDYQAVTTITVEEKTSSRWREEQGLSGATRVQAAPMTAAVKNTIAQLQQQDWFNAKQFKEQFGIDVNNLTDDMIHQFVNSQDTINGAMLSWASAANGDFSEALTKSFDTLGEQTALFDEAIQPALQALQTYASNLPGFENIGPEFRDSIMTGLKDIVIQPDLDASDMQSQARVLVQEFDNLTAEGSDYATSMKQVEQAQNKFAESLDASEYTEGTKNALETLNNLMEQYAGKTDVYSQAIAEYLQNQIDRIKNFTTDGAVSLNQALNEVSSTISAAEGAYDSFKEATKTDFSTGAEGMKSIFDEITKETDGIALHMEKRGDNTFWTGAKALLGDDFVEKNGDNIDKVKQQIKSLEPMLKEGEEGYKAFHQELMKVDPKEAGFDKWLKINDDGSWKIDTDIEPDGYKKLAEYLGMSEEFLVSMLNKGRQFQGIDFSNITDVRTALATDNAAITNGKNIFVKTDYLNSALSEAGYVNPKDQKRQREHLAKEGIIEIKNPDQITKKDFESMGIKDLSGLIKTFGDTGQFNRDEITQYAQALKKQMPELDIKPEDIAAGYDRYLQEQEHPEIESIQSIESTVAEIASMIASNRIEEGHIDNNDRSEAFTRSIFGEAGVRDTMAQKFSVGRNENGERLSVDEYKASRDILVEAKGQADAYINELIIGLQNATGKEKELMQTELDRMTQSKDKLEEYIKSGDEAFKAAIGDRAAEQARQAALDAGASKTDAIEIAAKARAEAEETGKEITQEAIEGYIAGLKNDGKINQVKQAGEETGKTYTDTGTKNIGAKQSTPSDTTSTHIIKEEVVGKEEADAKIADTDKQAKEPSEKEVKIKVTGQKQARGEIKQFTDAGSETKKIKVGANVDTSGAKKATSTIGSMSAKIGVGIKDNASSAAEKVRKTIDAKKASIDISPNYTGNWTKTLTVKKQEAATGLNNKIVTSHVPVFGSLAKGKKGRKGPRNQGGITLTGEEGYEVAWLPSEGRSLILGANGPQMVNLPKDATVWNHEQSKDILKKNKGIPFGSMGSGDAYDDGGDNGSSISSSKKKSTKKSKKKKTTKKKTQADKAPKTNQWSFEEVIRFDIDQNLLKLTSELNKLTKEIDKDLGKIGTTANKIGQQIQLQTDNLKAQLNYHQKELESYQRQQTDMGNFNAKISYNAGGKKDKEATIKFSDYMTQNADGIWVINEAAVQAAGNIAKQEAIYNAINGKIKEINDGIWKEQDTIYDLQNQIEENAKKVANAFYLWENELTEVYDLSQQIAAQTAMQDRFSSQVALELARLNTGFGDTAQSIAIITKANERNNQTLLQQIQAQKTMIEARERELDAFTTGTDELERLLAFRNAKVGTGKGDFSSQEVKDQAIAAAEQRLKAVEIARDYFVGEGPTKNQDGSLTYSIDWAKFNQDALNGQLSEETAKSVKDYFEKLNSANVDYNNAIKENTDTIKVAYDKLKEYQDYIVDFEDTLLQQLDDQLQQEIDNAEKLSSSITTSLKDLLDEVKRKLDERRKQEDNAKTERDISQKQQRLAALRADTSGGHQVEIAQLQKEIAEAQQSYGRTLEDQLLDRLQQQGDEAARQRERQIELAQAQLNISNSNNKELVNMWLKDPVKYRDEIKEAWMQAQDYESKGYLAQKQLNDTFNSSFAELIQATAETKASSEGGVSTIIDTITGFGDTINTQPESQISFQEQVTNALSSISTALSGQNNPLQDVAYHNTQSGTNKQGSVTVAAAQSLVDKGATDTELKQAGVTQDVINQTKKPTQPTSPSTIPTQIQQQQPSQPTIDPKQTYMDRLKEIKKLKANNVKSSHVNELFDLGAKAGYGKASVLLHLVDNTGGTDPFSWNNIFKAIINAKGIDRYNLVKTWPNGNGTLKAALATLGNPDTLSEIKKHKNYKKATALTFKTGGLADYTGPAWLDGTPSKPELVLNSTDTKNFLALRDVLSSAMNSMNTVSNSYGGDTLYEININVDKIEKDYDVDRVVEKVKKEITKGAGYRNVTQVRNLR